MDHVLVNEHIRWGPVVVVYMFLSAVGTGSLILSVLPALPWFRDPAGLTRVRRAALLSAAACFTVIPLAVIADLSQPWRMWRVLFAPQSGSAMPYGSWLLLLLESLILANLWLTHRSALAKGGRLARRLAFGSPETVERQRPAVERLHPLLAWASVAVGLAFVAYTGFLLSTMTSFGLWYTPLLGVVFAIAAPAAGFAWMGLCVAMNTDASAEKPLLRLLAGSAAAFTAAHLAVRLWDLAHCAYVENDAWPAIRKLLLHRFAVGYLGIEIVAGGFGAIVVLILAARRASRALLGAGSILALAGLFASRWVVIIGGQSISRTGHGFVLYEPHVFGREGLAAAAGLILWAFVIYVALRRWLPVPETNSGSAENAVEGRRRAVGTIAAAGLALAAGFETILAVLRPRFRKHTPGPSPLSADRVVHSVCLSCDARCGNRAVIRDGRVKTLFGNPYHPASTMNRPIPYGTSPAGSLRESGTLCLKGVSGIQYLYDPYRIRLPLKRTGPRGSGRFKAISWEQLVRELVEGGRLFADVGEDRHVEGLREIRRFEPIDPAAPELGPAAFGLVWNTGRGQPGREQFIQRFMAAYGSKNYVSHTDLCQMNWYAANYLFTGKYNPGVAGVNQLFGDIVNGEYMLFFGVNLGGGWKPGVNTSAPILANRHANRDGKLVLIDPYVPHGRHYADEWVPIKPATDAALALGMIRWILDNGRFAARYLESPSQTSAAAAGETTWTNATYLVVWDESDPRHRRFLRAKDLGLGGDEFVVIDAESGEPRPHDRAERGRLFVDEILPGPDGRGIRIRSSLQLLRGEASSRSLGEWARICGVPAGTIERLATEFTNHGRRASASCYRGATMHSQGIYAGLAINMLNALIGNMNWKGGVVRHASGPAWERGFYDLMTVRGAPGVKGVHISRIAGRSAFSYEDSTEHRRKVEEGRDPYPSERPWYPFSHAGITTEALAAADTGYPYRIKCWINYYINSRHSIPGGRRFEETFLDTARIPLFISVDTTVSETSVFSDYIVPDVMYLDGQWGFMGQQAGACTAPHVGVRSPAVEPQTGRTGDGRPMMLETFLIDLALALELPGFGGGAIPGEGERATESFDLRTAEDFYLRGVANLARNAGVEEPAAEEVAWVERNLPAAASKGILQPGEWRRASAILGRGGYFEAPEKAWDETGRHRGGVKVDPRAPLQFWHEVLATTRESSTGRLRPGTATYLPPEDGRGRTLESMDADYPFTVVTFRLATRTKARTAYDYWALEIQPENRIEINPDDARRLGIRTGDRVRIVSRSGTAEGAAKVSARVRPGVIAATHHFGHTQQGNGELWIEGAAEALVGGTSVSSVLHGLERPVVQGDRVIPDRRRGSKGFNVNEAMRRNADVLADTPLVDNAGGATVFLDSKVRLEKV
jgi:tetrathionate reductase subunit A